MSGIPRSAFAPRDFIMLLPELVKALDGDCTSALVLQRIQFRCNLTGEWKVSLDGLAADTWLSRKQVERATRILSNKGFIEVRHEAGYDRTNIYSVVYTDTPIAPTAEMDSAHSGNVPIEEDKEVTTSGDHKAIAPTEWIDFTPNRAHRITAAENGWDITTAYHCFKTGALATGDKSTNRAAAFGAYLQAPDAPRFDGYPKPWEPEE